MANRFMYAVFTLLILTGCSVSQSESSFMQDKLPTTLFPTPKQICRTAITVKHEVIGYDVEEDSVFFDYLPDKPINFLGAIFREINPAEDTNGIFDRLKDSIINAEYHGSLLPGEIFTSYLLTEESLNISDECLADMMYDDYNLWTYVKSFKLGEMNYRLITFAEGLSNWSECYAFIQMWNDEHLWAQPLMEFSRVYVSKNVNVPAQMFIDSKGREVIILGGYYREGGGDHKIICITGFVYDGDVWKPVVWDEIYEDGVGTPVMGRYKDGLMFGYSLPEGYYNGEPPKQMYYPTWKFGEDGTVMIIEQMDNDFKDMEKSNIYELFVPRKIE